VGIRHRRPHGDRETGLGIGFPAHKAMTIKLDEPVKKQIETALRALGMAD
jgi:hypothetical protein